MLWKSLTYKQYIFILESMPWEKYSQYWYMSFETSFDAYIFLLEKDEIIL